MYNYGVRLLKSYESKCGCNHMREYFSGVQEFEPTIRKYDCNNRLLSLSLFIKLHDNIIKQTTPMHEEFLEVFTQMYDISYYSTVSSSLLLFQAGINIEKILSALINYMLNSGKTSKKQYFVVHKEMQKCDIFVCDNQNMCAGYSIKAKTKLSNIYVHNVRGSLSLSRNCEKISDVSDLDEQHRELVTPVSIVANKGFQKDLHRSSYFEPINDYFDAYKTNSTIKEMFDILDTVSYDSIPIKKSKNAVANIGKLVISALKEKANDIIMSAEKMYSNRSYYELYKVEGQCALAQTLICTPPTILVFVGDDGNLYLMYFDGLLLYITYLFYNYLLFVLLQHIVVSTQNNSIINSVQKLFMEPYKQIIVNQGNVQIRGSSLKKYFEIFKESPLVININRFQHRKQYENVDFVESIMRHYVQKIKQENSEEIHERVYKTFLESIPKTEFASDAERIKAESSADLCGEFKIK